ncbi:hypothetical protein LCGC14_1796620 [marine sediment metagenome]|uniref:Uncharacterized protein n=1 Tax=marine sediment metagenome TaxID=412755 RepID=A0A0F9GQX9_9ZZZZ
MAIKWTVKMAIECLTPPFQNPFEKVGRAKIGQKPVLAEVINGIRNNGVPPQEIIR